MNQLMKLFWKRKFKKWWSRILQISAKLTITLLKI